MSHAGPTVAIVGGGWAGLAAAVELARHAVPVTVFESATQLGGRARTVEVHGLALDNGQHILLGAYHATLGLMRTIGVAVDRLCLDMRLSLSVRPNFRLRAPPLPAPLHLAWALLGARGLSLAEKLQAIRFMRRLQAMRFKLDSDEPLATFLDAQRQGPRICASLWFPLCLAALNTPPAKASAQVFVNVLRDGLFGSAADSRLWLPRRDLGQLLPVPARAYLERRGARVRLGVRIRRIGVGHGTLALQHDEEERFDHVICAVPPHRLNDLLGHLSAMQPTLAWARTLEYQPIYTVYLQYPAHYRLAQPMIGFAHGSAQWVFDRGALTGHAGLMSAVISADGPHRALDHDELARRIDQDLSAAFGWRDPPRWQQVIAEKRATFSCTPGLVRPPITTAVPGLLLAGDYVASPYPATIEAAVRSGIQSAQQVLEQCA